MKINDQSSTNGYFIRSYSPERITIAYPDNSINTDDNSVVSSKLKVEALENSFIIMADQLIRDWVPRSIDELDKNHCEQLLSLKPEVIILGTGNSIQFPDLAWSASLFEVGIGLEIMDTGAACRTYSILAADGRNVAAALMI